MPRLTRQPRELGFEVFSSWTQTFPVEARPRSKLQRRLRRRSVHPANPEAGGGRWRLNGKGWWNRVHGTDFSFHSVLFASTPLLHWSQSPAEAERETLPPVKSSMCWFLCDGIAPIGLCDCACEVHLCLFLTLVCRDTEGEQKHFEVAFEVEPTHTRLFRCSRSFDGEGLWNKKAEQVWGSRSSTD